ncbi:MAG: hypothetical protein M1305_07185 [Candidatus Marsarchaeota archaeon]|nr:hypothetical protein [Candidatus Marsarchaeota archaeon]
MKVIPDDGNGTSLEFGLPNPVRRKDPVWVSVRRVLGTSKVEDLTLLASEIVRSLPDAHDTTRQLDLFTKVHANLQRLWQIRERDIPTIEIEHEVEDVAEIFARLNRAGTRVKEADVVLALTAVRNPGWIRQAYIPFRDDLEDRGWDLEAGVFIRTMAGLRAGRVRLIEVPKDFWANIEDPWTDTTQIVREVSKQLAERGILCSDILPSVNSLIPLFVIHHFWKANPDYSFDRAFHWFLLANWDGRYSGSAITSLNEDVRSIHEARSFDEGLQSLRERFRIPGEVKAEMFLERYDRSGSGFLRLLLYLLLFHQGAKDWVDGTRIGFDKTRNALSEGFRPQWHHIYPRSILKKAGRGNDEVQLLANIIVLTEDSNSKKLSAKLPGRYIKEYRIDRNKQNTHLIPSSFLSDPDSSNLGTTWALERYDDFLLERAERLAHASNEFLEKLRQGS